MLGKPVIWLFLNMFQNDYNCWELSSKTLFLHVFGLFITKCAKTHAKRRIFTKIKMTHYYIYNSKIHLKSWSTLQKGHKQWIIWYLSLLEQVLWHLSKIEISHQNAIFCRFFAISSKNVWKRFQTAVISTKSKIQDIGSIFQKKWGKSTSMSKNAVFACLIPKQHLLRRFPLHLPKKFFTKIAIFCTFFTFYAQNVSKRMQ